MGIIRLLLALSVVLTHSFPLFGYTQLNGELAVQAFFVISGFYMTLILKEKYIGKNGSYFLYFSNRLLRIYPTYLLVLVLTLLTSFLLFQLNIHNRFDSFNTFYYYQQTHASLFYTTPDQIIKDLTLIGTTDYVLLSDMSKHMTIQQAWTLSIEILFYSIAPFIVRRFSFVLFFLFASLGFRYFVFHEVLVHHIQIPQRFFQAELVYFILGALSYYLYKMLSDRKKISHTTLKITTFVFVTITLLYQYIPIDISFRWMHFKGTWYILVLCLAIPFIFLFSKRSKIDRFIGELSYPIYIFHVLVILIFAGLPLQKINQNLFTTLILFITIGVSVIIVRYFEQPIENWRQARVVQIKKKKLKKI